MYQNRVTLIGFLGRDAEVKTTRNNAPFTMLSLATKRSWKDRESGERQSQTTWHRCIVLGKLGEFAATLTKGAHVQIEGEIRTREYTQKIATGKKTSEVNKSVTQGFALRRSRSSTGQTRTPAKETPPKGGSPPSRLLKADPLRVRTVNIAILGNDTQLG